mmetsp:Transcript_41696/g.61236  ORF Transcript_41696/g.61236 Transcript_41696/m.61236 type:complete len:297 (-) Transcript_41696:545-1435(-)
MEANFAPTYAPTLPVTTDADVRARREKEGRCADCGAQTHEVKRLGFRGKRREKIPLDVEGEVRRGRCLRCHPIRIDAVAMPVAMPVATATPPQPLGFPSARPITVVVGTRSKIKVGAVTEALSSSCPGGRIDVRGVDSSSGVPSQPRGRDETRRGAANRALGARRAAPAADLWIGIQNGVYENASGVIVDASCLVCYRADDYKLGKGEEGSVCFWSDELEVPTDGSMRPGPNGEWSYLKDPHAVLTGGARPRHKFISDAICQALEHGNLILPGRSLDRHNLTLMEGCTHVGLKHAV